MRGKTFQYLHVFKDAQGHRINVDRITAAEPQQSYLEWFEATGKTPPKASGRPRRVMPKQRFDRLKIASMNGSIVAFSVVSKVDPDWRMVTTLFRTANMGIDLGIGQPTRRRRAEQEMVEPQTGIAPVGIPKILPEGACTRKDEP